MNRQEGGKLFTVPSSLQVIIAEVMRRNKESFRYSCGRNCTDSEMYFRAFREFGQKLDGPLPLIK